MKNRNRFFCTVLLSGFALAALSFAKTPEGLTQQDCRTIFPRANSSEAVRTLDAGVLWTEAWEQGSWGPAEDFLGYVFMKSQRHEGGNLDVLVGITNAGIISQVRVKGVAEVDEKFLVQFQGKSLQENFDLARTPEDLHVIPAKFKAMQSDLALSESIARTVKEIAFSAVKVIK